MKFSNLIFLIKGNIKGNLKSTAGIILVCVMVISITTIPCYLSATLSAINEYKQDYRARALELFPDARGIDGKAIDEISEVEHIERIEELKGFRNQMCDILNVSGEHGDSDDLDEKIVNDGGELLLVSLFENEKRNVIKGKTLDECPVYSCIVPSQFYPYECGSEVPYELEYIDGTSLIGKTITVKGMDEELDVVYNYINSYSLGENRSAYLPSPEVKLKVVGTYYRSPLGPAGFSTVFVSSETAHLMIEESLKLADYDLNSKDSVIMEWWNTPSLHNHYIIVDDYDEIASVFNKVSERGYTVSNTPELMIRGSVLTLSNILGTAGIFIICVTAIFSVILLVQSSVFAINSRRGEIGLMKAIGYKDKQIFAGLFGEQLLLTVKAFLIGGTVSAVFIAVMNYINSHRSYVDMLYIVDWSNFLSLLAIALVFVITVPLICQLILIKKLTKIQPKDAMAV